jgi:CubicO group peptidase (beta-lactamase class C family)
MKRTAHLPGLVLRQWKIALALLAAGCALLLSTTPAQAAPWVARHGLSPSNYQAEFDKWSKQGFRLTYVSGYDANGSAHYAAIWEQKGAIWEQKGGPPYIARHGLTSAQYQTEFDNAARDGFRLLLVNGYTVAGQDRYVAIWEKSPGPPWIARHGLTSAQYQTEFDKWSAQGFRLVHVSGYGDHYAAIWHKKSGPALIARHGLTSAQYQTEFDKQLRDAYRLVHVSGYAVNGQERYAAIWEKTSGVPWIARHGLDSTQYQHAFTDYLYSGYKPALVSGYGVGGHDKYAAIWENVAWSHGNELAHIDSVVHNFLARYDIPGLSMAIAKDGRLVFAKAYGFADKAAGELAHTQHRWRIASVSKSLTSAALFRLIETKGASFQEARTVFGPAGVLGTRFGSQPYKPYVASVRLSHLLRHTEGGWQNDANDPMFSNPQLSQADLISWTLDHRPLDRSPGASFAYSNFGYELLGRVIEQESGKSYEAYVRDAVLAPSGVTDMQIGGDTRADRKANEVVYYDGNSNSPYTMKVARMDAHGGWIAKPIDLVRFGVHVDGSPTKPDILTPASILSMTTGSTANPGYACGWATNAAGNWWHNGSLPGTFSILVRTKSGFVWAAIVNSRKNDPDLDKMMWDVVNGVHNWPTYDLF